MVGCGYTKKQERKTRERNRRGRRKRKANNTTSKYNEKTKDHVRQMKELTEEWIQDWEKLVERGAKEDVQSLNGWWPPLKFHKLNPFPCQTHEWTGSGQRLDFFNNFDSRRGWEKNVARRARCLQIAFGQQTKGPANNMASVFLAFNTKIEHVGCHANLFDRGNVQRNDQRGWMACKEMFFFCFRRYGGWYKRDLIASLPCQRWPFGLCMSHVGGKPRQDWQIQGPSRIGKFLFSMGWLKCQRLLIFRGSSLTAPAGRWNRCKKGAVLTAKRSKWGRSTWLGWSDLVERLLSIREGTGGVSDEGIGSGWAMVPTQDTRRDWFKAQKRLPEGGYMRWWCWSREAGRDFNSYLVFGVHTQCRVFKIVQNRTSEKAVMKIFL